MSSPVVNFKPLGLLPFSEVWDIQEELLKENLLHKTELRREENADQAKILLSASENPRERLKNHLIFCQHPHVYTIGKGGDEKNLLIGESNRKQLGIEYFRINRGGDITYHGPGQLVGYPIFDLEQFKPDINWYLRSLEESIILTLDEYGIRGTQIKGLTGVWLRDGPRGQRKILAIGVRCSRWITMHGFAFNINTDLSFFRNIIPCGITEYEVTTLSGELGQEMNFDEVSEKVLKNMKTVFNFRLAEPSAQT